MVKKSTPELDRLYRRVRLVAKQRGAKARLAELLGVLSSTLSDWLSGRYEPGGEVTLKLQKWVIAAEAKSTKTDPARVSARTGQMTRNDNDEKAKSDRPKG